MLDKIIYDTMQTLYMVFSSCFIAVIFGLPLGIFLCITKKDSIYPLVSINIIIGTIVNITRSFPFIILIILILPISRFIVGTSVGSTTAIIPLSISAIPFVARLFENALDEVDKCLIEAARSMGASNFMIVKMMILESMPSIVSSITITMISLVGYSAMAGAVGAGGIGDLALRVGYYTSKPDILFYCVLIIIVLVQSIQCIGDFIIKYLRKFR